MKIRYLNKEAVVKRYNFIDSFTNYAKNIGVSVGLSFSLLGMGQDIRMIVGGLALGTFSFVSGTYMPKLNNWVKEKKINNLEKGITFGDENTEGKRELKIA